MEFPIEIQMLINDYARPLTRPDWKKGSFINRTYRSWGGQLGRLNISEFKEYLIKIKSHADNYDDADFYRYFSYASERRDLDDIGIHNMRMEEHS